MRFNQRFYLFVLLFVAASCSEKTLFEQLEADVTGITFNNQIEQNADFNIITHTNIFNGGGVAIADFNNNGYQDIYFTGNLVDNQLYLNHGGFTFEDVTEQANVAGKGRWSSGAAVVDIDGNGLMDIYVSATTYEDPEKRANLFYINRGVNENNIPVFEEMAVEYNVADTSHTTMAVFFDYNNNGRLDLFLMNNQFTRNSSMDKHHEKMLDGESVTTDRLYRNEGADSLGHPYFTDVSEEAGILIEGFGLGVNIVDINQDGWKDIYIANDFITNDVLYINNGDGTFTDKAGEFFKHTSYAAMGNDVADINNNGRPDVVVVDMRPEDNYRQKMMLQPNNYSFYTNNEKFGYDYQYVRNVLQVNEGNHPETGNPVFSDIGIFAGISETDWSWAPLLVDFDNDGWRDLFVTNGFPKDITDRDFVNYFNEYHRFMSLDKLLELMPSVKIENYIFRNEGDLTFRDVTDKWGMDIPSFSNGAAHVDLNNDGALDLVINNINQEAFVLKNRASELNPDTKNYLRIQLKGKESNTLGLGSILKIEYDNGKEQYHEHTIYRGYLSSVEPIVHFGLGNSETVDVLTVIWPDSSIQKVSDIKANQVLTIDQLNATEMRSTESAGSVVNQKMLMRDITNESGINYVHEESDFNDFRIQPLLPNKFTQSGPGLSVADVNGNGLDDIYISGASGFKGVFFVQQQDGTFRKEDLFVENDSEKPEYEMGSLFFDANGNGKNDLYIVSGGYENSSVDKAYQDRIFVNEGGTFRKVEGALPPFLTSGSVVRAADFDKDGTLDLFVGGRVMPHQYPKPVNSYLLKNNSESDNIRFEIVNDELAPVLNEIGMVSDAIWTDFNNDGWVDLILAGEWMSLRFLENDSGTFTDVTDQTGINENTGWWNSLCAGDFDQDGNMDYIAGNLGTNTFFQASEKYPVRIYGNDFNNNGLFEMFISVYRDNGTGEIVEVPFNGRQDFSKQFMSITGEFENFHAFATAGTDDILARYNTDKMLTYHANNMKSSFIKNHGDGTFDITPLPGKAQWAPVNGCVVKDLNGNGNLDVILTGNHFGAELTAGRLNASNGLVLLGEGDGTFKVMNFEESGFFVPGDGKALVKLNGVNDSQLLAASQNSGPLKLFKTSGQSTLFQAEPMDESVILHYEDGTSQKIEFMYGSSYLSASARFISVSNHVKNLEVTDYQGNKRTIIPDQIYTNN